MSEHVRRERFGPRNRTLDYLYDACQKSRHAFLGPSFCDVIQELLAERRAHDETRVAYMEALNARDLAEVSKALGNTRDR